MYVIHKQYNRKVKELFTEIADEYDELEKELKSIIQSNSEVQALLDTLLDPNSSEEDIVAAMGV